MNQEQEANEDEANSTPVTAMHMSQNKFHTKHIIIYFNVSFILCMLIQ